MNNIEKFFEYTESQLKKEAYPNTEYRDPLKYYDVNKWVLSMQKIESLMKEGNSKYSSVDSVTKGWASKELNDFINWMKYYESGDFIKYKFASLYSNANNPGYYLQIQNNKVVPMFDKNESVDNSDQINEEQEKKIGIEDVRKKVLSRLKSIDRLLENDYSRELLGSEHSKFSDLVTDLIKKLRNLKKISKTNSTYADFIIREANINLKNNRKDNFIFLQKLAQAVAPPPAQNKSPTNVSGYPSMTPGEGPGLTPPANNLPNLPNVPPVPPAENKNNESEPTSSEGGGINDFVSKFKGDYSDIGKKDKNKSSDDFIFVSEAQVAESQPVKLKEPEPNNIVKLPEQEQGKNYDNAIDTLFANVKIEDVVQKLEQLSNIFKEREIPRQLAIIDMMLSALNLSPMFPALSESHNKALESNNYILTRIEEIISKLRGAIKKPPIDLENKDRKAPSDPRANDIASSLKQEEELDAKKKQMRKDLENQALKETPEIEVSEEAAPTVVNENPTPPAPTPAKPLPPKV